MAGPAIISTVPVSGAVGVPINTTISIIFDQEVDTYRLKNGGIFLEGPDESKSIGPGMLGLEPPETDEDKFLSSPGLKGIQSCSFSFYRVDGSGASVDYYDYGDTAQAGQLYRTKVVLTPETSLKSLTEYSVYIVGDEDITDEYDFGLTTRSVFDPIKGPNLGTGDVLFYGGYTGSIRQRFFIEITNAGAPGTATYEWWTSVDSLHRTGTSSLGYRLLQDGLNIKFLEGQVYEVGDSFSVWCDVPLYQEGSYKFSFVTSSNSPTVLPTPSGLITGITGSTLVSGSTFEVSSTSPADRSLFNSITLVTITVTFSASLNAGTITDSTVTVEGSAVDGSRTGTPAYTDSITKTLSVGTTTLTITLDPDQVFENNLIRVTLSSSDADTTGNTLGTDYSFFYVTDLNPFYAGIRHVRLRLGSLGNYYTDDTIAFAIWDASREADAFAPYISIITDTVAYERARTQFVVCFAALLLISGNTGASGDSVRKRLGDFDVSRSSPSGKTSADDLKDCISYYQAIMEGGGELSPLHKPVNVVKGEYDIDSPAFGRLWEVPDYPIANARSTTSGSLRWQKTFLARTRGNLRSRWERE